MVLRKRTIGTYNACTVGPSLVLRKQTKAVDADESLDVAGMARVATRRPDHDSHHPDRDRIGHSCARCEKALRSPVGDDRSHDATPRGHSRLSDVHGQFSFHFGIFDLLTLELFAPALFSRENQPYHPTISAGRM